MGYVLYSTRPTNHYACCSKEFEKLCYASLPIAADLRLIFQSNRNSSYRPIRTFVHENIFHLCVCTSVFMFVLFIDNSSYDYIRTYSVPYYVSL